MALVDLVELASAYWRSFALNAGVELEIFPALAAMERSAEGLAGELDLSEPHLRALLDSLAGMDLLTKRGDRYGLHPDQRDRLDPTSPDCMLEAFRFNADLAGLWLKLPDCVREGRPALPDNPHLGGDAERTRRFVRGMHSRAGIMARGLLPCLRPAPGSRILDVGGGPGTFSLKLAERDPTLRITVLDLPPVARAAEAIHADHPAVERLTFLGGDYHTADYPGDQDLVLYCGAAHQEPEESLSGLFDRMRGALKPGGELAVVDLMLDSDRTTPAYSALFELNMMLMRPRSRVHATDRILNLLETAGFAAREAEEVIGTPYRLVRARRT